MSQFITVGSELHEGTSIFKRETILQVRSVCGDNSLQNQSIRASDRGHRTDCSTKPTLQTQLFFILKLTRASVQVTGVIILYLRFVTVEMNPDPCKT